MKNIFERLAVTLCYVSLLSVLAFNSATGVAQEYKMTTPFAPGVAVPNEVETSIGTLNLDIGYPDDASTQKVYDNLDASRALQAYLLAIPIVNQAGMRASLKEFGPVNRTDVIWEDLVDSKTVELTANDNTIYSFIWLDTKKGPLVVEIPPMVQWMFTLVRSRLQVKRPTGYRRFPARAGS